jgi:site-specific DNA-methyltransferase (adenine-specific)
VSLKKQTQNGPRGVYQFVPLQDFSKSWTDQKLYKKYDLTTDEIAFIERKIRPMELDNE